MANKCISCGRDNEDSSHRCVCGAVLQAAVAIDPANSAPTAAGGSPSPPPNVERTLGRRRLGIGLWALGFVPLFAALRAHLHVSPLPRTLIGTGVFCATVVAGVGLLGRDQSRAVRVWRLGFLLWAVFVTPLLLTIVDGLAEQGWPSGRPNRTIARILVMLLALTVPAFLTGIGALVRSYRLAGALAIATGLASLVSGYLLISALAPFRGMSLHLVDILNIVIFGAKALSYAAIPAGLALIVGGILLLRNPVSMKGGNPAAKRPAA
jgi:hypothetical protein